MASQKMTQTIRIVEKRGLAALLDKFFPDKKEEKEKKKKVKSLKDVTLKEEDETDRDKSQS